MEDFITRHTFQVNKPNGDIDFITVDDLTDNVALKFVQNKYPGLPVELIEEEINIEKLINNQHGNHF